MEIVEKLTRDHELLRSLLRLFEHELLTFEHDGEADLQLMQDIARHYSEYFNHVHHRLEDTLYERLLARGVIPEQETNQAVVEHAELITSTANVLSNLNKALNGVIVPRLQLVDAGHRFIDLNMEHMALEERTIFQWAGDKLPEEARNISASDTASDDFLEAYAELLNRQMSVHSPMQ